MSAAELVWIKPDDYHIATECARYSVARITVSPFVHYIAWRRDATKHRELDSVKLPADAPDADRMAAIKKMQQRCAEHASTL